MTAFPIFNRLRVDHYGLYPGSARKPGLDVEFQSGLTLILGANGLGKTTLITMLYRMCTGPYDIPALSGSGELGNVRLDARKLRPSDRRIFADRVNDGAESATATLSLAVGDSHVSLTRSLMNLELLNLEENGSELNATEERYQELIIKQARINTFSDWILILRHLVFYFEERRALVWDPSAQRQLLRLLFLAPRASEEWSDAERDVLQRDSAMRNFQSVLTREERSLTDAEHVASSDGNVREDLATLERLQAIDQPRLEDLNDGVAELSAAQQAARLNQLKAEDEHESAYRNLERLQLETIAAAFPSASDTARYLLAQLISDEECLACGSHAPRAAATLRRRAGDDHCVLCNSPIKRSLARKSTSRDIVKATKELERAGTRLRAASERCSEAEAELQDALTAISELNSTVTGRSARIEQLARELPPEEAELHAQRRELSAMRARLESMRRELDARRTIFARLIKRTSRDIVTRKDDVQLAFQEFARGFLLEECALAWAPHKDRVGETGPTIDFPAFELEMGGADFPSPVRREGPQQVSESQREFIDLAFRMALIRVAGTGAKGSIVIDAPESSLDAVFVTRAADVLTRYAGDADNRLVVTSNLVEGDLIPELMRRNGVSAVSSKRVIDLLEIAAPTAATRALKVEYQNVRKALFRRASR